MDGLVGRVHVEVPDEPPADASFEQIRSYHDLHGAASDDAALALAAVSLRDLLARTEYEPTLDDETLAATTELPETTEVSEEAGYAAGESLPLGKAPFAAWSTYAGRTDGPHVDAELLLRSAGFVATTGAYPTDLERRAEAVRTAVATPDPPAVDEAHLDAASPGWVVGDEADREGYDDLLGALGVGVTETLDAGGAGDDDAGESAGQNP